MISNTLRQWTKILYFSGKIYTWSKGTIKSTCWELISLRQCYMF